MWSRSSYAKKMDPVLNTACRAISGCLKPTQVDNLNLLCSSAPLSTRREVTSQVEQTKQEVDPRHPLYQHKLAKTRHKSRRSFLHDVQPLKGNIPTHRIEAWSRQLEAQPHKLSFNPKESPSPGASEPWPIWLCLNRVRVGVGRCKALIHLWGCDTNDNDLCDCGEAPQTMEHLLPCPLLPEPCRPDDLEVFNPHARACDLLWPRKM